MATGLQILFNKSEKFQLNIQQLSISIPDFWKRQKVDEALLYLWYSLACGTCPADIDEDGLDECTLGEVLDLLGHGCAEQ